MLDLTPKPVTLEAEPKPLTIDLRQTAVVVVDMQNAYLAKGAFLDLIGTDVTPGQATIKPIQQICTAARASGCKIVFIVTAHHPGDAGTGPQTVYWHKEGSLALYREHPELKDKLLLPGTWGTRIVEELAPQRDDIVVEKPRYSGFFDTNLDTVLKRFNIKYLLTVGVATNNCVEATIRDAYYRGYFAILVSDATAATGPAFMQEASIYNVKRSYGWVTNSASVVKAMR